MVSAANFKALAKGGGKYLMAMPMRRGDEITEAVVSHPGRYKPVAENLQVKEVVVGEGTRRYRYTVCFNPQEVVRQRAHREEVLKELTTDLESLRHVPEEGHSKRECALLSSGRYGKYLKTDPRWTGHQCSSGEGCRTLRWQVRGPQQRRQPQHRGHGVGLQAAAACGRSLGAT